MRVAGALMIVGASAAAVLTADYASRRASLRARALADAATAVSASAAELDRDQRTLETLVDALAADLTSGALPVGAIEPRLRQAVEDHPEMYGMGVGIASVEDQTAHFLTVVRDYGTLRFVDLQQLHDRQHLHGLEESDWYNDVQVNVVPGWHGPYYAEATGHFVAYYCHPWGPADRPGDSTHVCAGYSLHDMEAARKALPAGRYGYAWVLSKEARSLSHPDTNWVRTRRTMDEVAQSRGIPELREIGRRATMGEAGTLRMRDPMTNEDALALQEPVPASGWSVVAVVLDAEIVAGVPALKRLQVLIATAVVVALGGGGALAFLLARR